MRLIDADALKQVTEESIAEYDGCYTRDTIFGMRSVVYYATTDAPTVDAVPVRHGKWIRDEFGARCSDCGLYAYRDKFDKPWESPYCPICGARMDAE